MRYTQTHTKTILLQNRLVFFFHQSKQKLQAKKNAVICIDSSVFQDSKLVKFSIIFGNSAGSGNYVEISFSKHSMIALQYWNVWYECSQKRSHHFLRGKNWDIEVEKDWTTTNAEISVSVCVGTSFEFAKKN